VPDFPCRRCAGPSRFRRTACSPHGWRWSDWPINGARSFAARSFARSSPPGRRIDDTETIGAILSKLNVEPSAVLAAALSDDNKARLRAETEEAQRLGLFGAPSFSTADGELFWGNDRLEHALAWAKQHG
jgi:2-hydroxychromene-2-carboxylate isomerase